MASLLARLPRQAVFWIILGCVVIVAAAVIWVVNRPGDPDTAADGAYRDAALPVEERVADLLGRMTLEEKVGQMTQAEVLTVGASAGDIGELGIGSLLSGGSDALHQTPQDWAAMIDGYQREALDSRLGIPMLYGIDAVHGNGSLPGATIFPHNIGLGATRDPALVEQVSAVAAMETRASGIPWTFAPCLCVARDSRWGRTYEAFGEDPDLVSAMAVAVEGFQGEDLSANTSVMATAKHFVGDGGTTYGSSTTGDYRIDQGVTELSEEELRRLHLAPFEAAISADVGSIMASFSSTDRGDGPLKVHADEYLLTEVLKGELGFAGFVVSDWEAIDQISDDYAESVRLSVNAGIDMVMVPFAYRDFIATLIEEVEAGRVAESRIDDAVGRILTKKFELGLFEQPFADLTHAGAVGSAEHRALAREAAAASQVLLKNDGDLLPLTGGESIYVAGSAADSLGRQLGGWTASWQGTVTATTTGTTILEGIREAAPDADLTHSADASEPTGGHDVGIVVVGEDPYAEGVGDVGVSGHDMELSEEDIGAIETVCEAMDCAVVVVSGRPIAITDQLDDIDALVAAWLPGSEGTGVADPLFGATGYAAALPISWPHRVEDEPVNVGDPDYRPLFSYDLGLRTEPVA